MYEDCGGLPVFGGRAADVVVIGVLAIAYVAVVVIAHRGARRPVGLLFVGTAVIGLLIAAVPGGLSDADANYVVRCLVGAVVGGAIGAIAAGAGEPREAGRRVLVGAMGGGGFILWAAGLLLLALAVDNSCLD